MVLGWNGSQGIIRGMAMEGETIAGMSPRLSESRSITSDK